MELNITDKHKKALFTYLFQTLKHCTTTVHVHFNISHVHIQGLDASHICMFNVHIQQDWFDAYTVLNQTHISFDTHTFHTIISSCQDSNNIYIRYDESNDSLLNTWVDEQHIGQLQNCKPIVVCDMWEHAFVYDYPTSQKKDYIEACYHG